VLALLGPWSGAAAPGCPSPSRIAYAPWSFFGYACVGSCGEQKAGFQWAERHGIADPMACTAGTAGFVAGCRAYAEYAVTAEQAGFEWARENEVSDPCACDGAGRAFREGCMAYFGITGE